MNQPLIWVELVRRYSNRPDLRERLAEASRRASQRDQHEPDDNTAALGGRIPVAGRVRDRLTDADVQVLIGEFRAGTTKRVLADHIPVSQHCEEHSETTWRETPIRAEVKRFGSLLVAYEVNQAARTAVTRDFNFAKPLAYGLIVVQAVVALAGIIAPFQRTPVK